MLNITRRIRPHQQAFHRYLTTTPAARAIAIWHRRAGKDEIVLGATCELAHKRIGSYWHCLPEFAQGRKAIWTAVNAQTGKRRIDEAFPPEIRDNTNDHEMFIRLKCGSTWQVVGSDRYDNLVGAGVAGVAFSEWALANPSAWGYMRPMVEENNGWAAFITTPRGRNHAYDMYNMAQKHKDRWFSEVLSVHDTGALTAKQMQEALEEYQSIYGDDIGLATFQQEYECSFNAAILGAFYGREMAEIRRTRRIAPIEAVPWKPIHRAWDLGVRDDTSVWFFQVVGNRVFVLDCYTDNGGIEYADFAKTVKDRCEALGVDWQEGTDFVPHDAAVLQFGIGRTRVEDMIRAGLKPEICPRATKLDGINAARLTLKTAVFHERCEEEGIAALEQYRREWDDQKKAFKATELHDWSSHLADAFRYLSLSWKTIPDIVVPEAPKQPPPGYIAPPPVVQPSSGRIRLR